MTKEETKARFQSWCQQKIGNNCSDEDYAMFNNIMALLEQQPSDDCVSREEVKKWLDINFCFGGAINKLNFFEKMDKEIPPVTLTQRWIPVSERLPEKYGYYLCSLYYSIPPYDIIHPENDTYIHDVSVQKFDRKSFIKSVKAWMPLPKPYKDFTEII